jgi:hypothetical protein
MGVLTVVVSRGRVLLGFLMLSMSMMVGGLQVMVGGGVMSGRSLVMMFNRCVFVLLWHDPYPQVSVELERIFGCNVAGPGWHV